MLNSSESAILIRSCDHIGRLIVCAAIIIIYGFADIVIVNTKDSFYIVFIRRKSFKYKPHVDLSDLCGRWDFFCKRAVYISNVKISGR